MTDSFLHNHGRMTVVDRESWLCAASSGQDTTHIGFVDEGCLDVHLASGEWLHARLATVARSLVGIDVDEAGVRWAQQMGYDAACFDSTDLDAVSRSRLPPADVIIAGEVIEHLDAPGALFEAAKLLIKPHGRLIITTPNALASIQCVLALLGRELAHPGHVTAFTVRTLTALAVRHGWVVQGTFMYRNREFPVPATSRLRKIAARPAKSLYRLDGAVTRWAFPLLSHGIILDCSIAATPAQQYPD